MAGSRAFIFSGRLRRTSATPPSMVTDTRSDMGSSLPCMPDSPAMNLNLTADEVLTTTRAVRKRLDLERPVEREVLLECLDIALQAPTGSNSQGWQWMFVEDPDKKKAIADYYGANFDKYVGSVPSPYPRRRPPAPSSARASRRRRSTCASTSTRCRCMLIPLLEGRAGPRRRHPGRLLGLDPAGGVELHAGPALAGPGLGVDHAAPVERGRGGRAARASRPTATRRPACSPSPTRRAPTSSRRSGSPRSGVVHFDTW